MISRCSRSWRRSSVFVPERAYGGSSFKVDWTVCFRNHESLPRITSTAFPLEDTTLTLHDFGTKRF